MKVFRVYHSAIDDPEICFGVYSTRKKAEAREKHIGSILNFGKPYKPSDYSAFGIEEIELDFDTENDFWMLTP